ncbi:hypothetical protein [Streptomyces aurantiogriseus]|uniref:hypothetical protein n=1 Tax=Streptomyces aurantiogriseus TaxID=66870 RepID=UPI0016750E38|nr:hypothetical protein [Streptomyces aurantiogriseus]
MSANVSKESGRRIAEQGTTVGRKVYATANNRAPKALKDMAEKMGYERIFGVGIREFVPTPSAYFSTPSMTGLWPTAA